MALENIGIVVLAHVVQSGLPADVAQAAIDLELLGGFAQIARKSTNGDFFSTFEEADADFGTVRFPGARQTIG